MGTTPITESRPFGALAAAAAALGPVRRAETAPSLDYGAVLAEAADTLTTPADEELGRLLAAAADTLDTEDFHRVPAAVGGTMTTALTLARTHGGSVAVSDAHIELGLALRRRLARAGATTGADFDGDRLRVQPSEVADNP